MLPSLSALLSMLSLKCLPIAAGLMASPLAPFSNSIGMSVY